MSCIKGGNVLPIELALENGNGNGKAALSGKGTSRAAACKSDKNLRERVISKTLTRH